MNLMARPEPPRLGSMTVSEDSRGDITYTSFEAQLAHPFTPWGPITKFYVTFTVRPVHQLTFQLHGHTDTRSYYYEPIRTGIVLAREYQGGGNFCIWSSLIMDKLANINGFDPVIAKTVAKNIHDCLIETHKMKLMVAIEVDLEVVIPVGNGIVPPDGIFG